jgi:hypothetical protein
MKTKLKDAIATLALGLSSVIAVLPVTTFAAPPAPTLQTPGNNASNVSKDNLKFTWTFDKSVTNQRIVISQNQNFTGFKDSNNTSGCDNTCLTRTTSDSDRITIVGNTASFTKTMDLSGKTYWWKVRVNSPSGTTWSGIRSFTTAGQSAKTTPLSSSYMSNLSQGFGGWNSDFGGYHTGYDIATTNSNPTVSAIEDGIVQWNSTSSSKYTGNYNKYFNAFVVVKHGNFYAYYGHLNSSLAVGSKVTKGSAMGTIRDAYTKSGNLNKSNNHLHISISTGSDWVRSGWGYQTSTSGVNQFVNPASYIGL